MARRPHASRISPWENSTTAWTPGTGFAVAIGDARRSVHQRLTAAPAAHRSRLGTVGLECRVREPDRSLTALVGFDGARPPSLGALDLSGGVTQARPELLGHDLDPGAVLDRPRSPSSAARADR